MNNDPEFLETPRERKPDPGLFERWINTPFWYPKEGVALAFGLNPKLIVRAGSNGRGHIIADDTFQRFVELAASAVKTGALAERSLPFDFLAWAETVGLKFHGVWREALEILSKGEPSQFGSGISSQNHIRAKLIHDWVDAPNWTVDEGVALSLSIEPRRVQSGTLSPNHPLSHNHPKKNEFDRRRQFAWRACEQLAIDRNPKPRDFIAWAGTVDIRFHPDWHAALPSEPSPPNPEPARDDCEKPLGTRERTSLLKLAIGVAMGAYGYNPRDRRSKIVREIANDLERHGIPLDPDTIRKYLREGAELVPPMAQDE